jgi:hypothetical protein
MGRAPPRYQGGSPSSHPSQTGSRPRRRPPEQNEPPAANSRRSSTYPQQDYIDFPGIAHSGTNDRDTVTSGSPKLTHKQLDIELPSLEAVASRDTLVDIPGYDHSWVEYYPLPPHIRTRTQSQEGLPMEGGRVGLEGRLSPGVGMPRMSSLPSVLDIASVGDGHHIRPAIDLRGSRKRTGASGRKVNGTYPENIPKPSIEYGNASLSTQSTSPAKSGEAHGRIQSAPTTAPTTVPTKAQRIGETQNINGKSKGRRREHLSGKINGTSLVANIDRVAGALALKKSWADIVEEEEEDQKKGLSASGAGFETSEFEQGNTVVTEIGSQLDTRGPPQSLNGDVSYLHKCIRVGIGDSVGAMVGSRQSLVRRSQGSQVSNANQDVRSDRGVSTVGCGGRSPASTRRTYNTVNEATGEACISVITGHSDPSSPGDLGLSNAELPVIRQLVAESRSRTIQQGVKIGATLPDSGLRFRMPSASPEASPVLSQSTSVATEPFPNFDDSHFVQLQTPDSSLGIVARSAEDTSDGLEDDQPLLPHERLSALSGSSEKPSERDGRQLGRDPRCARSPSIGEDQGAVGTAKIDRLLRTQPGSDSEHEVGYILLDNERLKMPTHMLSVSWSATSKSPQPRPAITSRPKRESTRSRTHTDQEGYEVESTLQLKDRNGEASLGGDSASKGEKSGPMESGHFPGIASQVSPGHRSVPDLTELDASWSRLRMSPLGNLSEGGEGCTMEMQNQRKKETLLVRGGSGEIDGNKVLERGGSTDPTTVRYHILAQPVSQKKVSVAEHQAPIPRVDSQMEISGAPKASGGATRRWVPERTVVAMTPASNRNWIERLGQASDFEPVVRLQTPGFDLSTMSFAERLRAPRPRDPLPSAWIKSPSELSLGNVKTEAVNILLASRRSISPTETLPHIAQTGASFIHRRGQRPSTNATIARKEEDLAAKPGKLSKTKANKATKINGLPAKEKQEGRVAKQVPQLQKRPLSMSEQGSSTNVTRNKTGATNLTGNVGKLDKVKTAVAIPHVDFTRPIYNRAVTAQGRIQLDAAAPQIKDSQAPDEKMKDGKANEYQRRPRSATMIPGPITPGGTLRSDRVTARAFGVISPLRTYKLKVTTPEWSEIASSTSSLATFMTAPESPILPWSPIQDHWGDQSPIAPQFAAPDISFDDSYVHPTTIDKTSNPSVHQMVSLREADNSPVTIMAESPSTMTEKAGEGEYLTAKVRPGDTELPVEFLLQLVSELSPESYKDIYQKYPSELESLLRLRRAPKTSRTTTESSVRTVVPQPTLSTDRTLTAALAHATERQDSKNDADHETVLTKARRGKKKAVASPQETPDTHQTKEYADTMDEAASGQSSKTWPGLLGQNPEVSQTEHRREAEESAYPLYGYFNQPERVSHPKSQPVDQASTIDSSGPHSDQGPHDSANPISNDSAIVAQGQNLSSSGGRKPTKRYARKKYNRPVIGDGPTPVSRQPAASSEPTVPKESLQLVQGVGPSARGCYSAHSDSLTTIGHMPTIEPYARSLTGLHGTTVYYNPTHLSSVQASARPLPLSIPNNFTANSMALQAWTGQAFFSLPTIWMDYYGKIHSRKPAYPKYKWIGNEMKILPKSERVLPPGWTNQEAPEPRIEHTQHSHLQARTCRNSIDSHRSPERNTGGDGRVPGRGSRTPGSLPTHWVGQDSVSSRLGEPDMVEGTPHRPVEIVTGFLPCKKGEVTLAVEDLVRKCPNCDPDYLHESDL